jgi:putative phosphoesterase
VFVAALADTHLTHASRRRLPASAEKLLGLADVILHAGDVTDASLLDELAGYGPVHAVLGNNDTGLDLPETVELTLDGVAVAMIHDSGPRAGRERRMRKRFPHADVVVFGHSHIPWNAVGIDAQLLFNPGSPTQRRRQPFPTMGFLECSGGRLVRHDVVRLDS